MKYFFLNDLVSQKFYIQFYIYLTKSISYSKQKVKNRKENSRWSFLFPPASGVVFPSTSWDWMFISLEILSGDSGCAPAGTLRRVKDIIRSRNLEWKINVQLKIRKLIKRLRSPYNFFSGIINNWQYFFLIQWW